MLKNVVSISTELEERVGVGFLRPSVLVVSGLYEDAKTGLHWAERARLQALEIFGSVSLVEPPSLVDMVSELSLPLWNGARSFAVWWDGSREGWAPSDAADGARAEFIGWLREQVEEDGSSPLRWVELSYADDDGVTMVLATSADRRNLLRGREHAIRLEIEEERKSAFVWAELDGVQIRDPDGWRDGVGELGPRPLEDRIGRGEFERRLEVSTVVGLG